MLSLLLGNPFFIQSPLPYWYLSQGCITMTTRCTSHLSSWSINEGQGHGSWCGDSLASGQNGCRLADNIFKCVFLKWIVILGFLLTINIIDAGDDLITTRQELNYLKLVMAQFLDANTVQYRYNAVNFLKNIKRHPITLLSRRGMEWLLWIQHLVEIFPQFLQLLMQYLIILDGIIAALDCVCL